MREKTKTKNKMIDSEYNFEKGDELSDTKLIIEEKIIHVHKAILGIYM